MAQDLAPHLQDQVDLIDRRSPSEELSVAGICSAVPKLIMALDAEGALTPSIAEALAQHYADGLRKQFGPTGFDAVRRHVFRFEGVAQSASDRGLSLMQQGPGRDFAQNLYATQIEYSSLILQSFAFCMRVDTSALTALEEWLAAKALQQGNLEHETESIERIRAKMEEKPVWSHRFRLTAWPYLIIVALSLKFGKGVAAVRP